MSDINQLIDKFRVMHTAITELYLNTNNWLDISNLIHNNNQLFRDVYKAIAMSDTTGIKLDYAADPIEINKLIEAEINPVFLASEIITSCHQIVYSLLSQKANYLFTLNGKEEMIVLKKDIQYYISLYSKPEQNIFFHAFILIYALESLFTKNFYLGIDFEQTNKKIQLAQLNFEHSIVLESIIMLVSPNDLEADIMDDFVHMIICNRRIKKILHGSDSLDVPYIYDRMLQGDPTKIIAFTQALIDTRFLCEYYKLNHGDPLEYRCSIYNVDPDGSAIYFFGVVSKEQQDKLAVLLESMPPHHDIQWNIRQIPFSQIDYAMRDALYLKWFYLKIINVATLDANTDPGKKVIITLYKHVLNELTRFVYLEGRSEKSITFLTKKCKEEVDPVNNYMIRSGGSIIKLIDLFKQFSTGIITSDPKVDIDTILRVNHFKKSIQILIKKFIYTSASRNCKVYKDKSTIWNEKLSNDFVFDFFRELEFNYLYKMLQSMQSILDGKVRALCRK